MLCLNILSKDRYFHQSNNSLIRKSMKTFQLCKRKKLLILDNLVDLILPESLMMNKQEISKFLVSLTGGLFLLLLGSSHPTCGSVDS